MPKRKRGRPKKSKNLIKPSTDLKPSSDDARESLEEIISYFKNQIKTEKGLSHYEIKSLTTTVDALIKLGREERAIAEQLRKLSVDVLIKLAKKAARVLKKKDTIITE